MTPYRTEDYHWHLPGWPGAYDGQPAATYALQFGHEVLERLQASVNPGGVIGLGMLQRAWAGEIPETWEQRLAREASEAKERKRCSQCRKLVSNVSNLNGERLCGPCLSRRSAVAPTPCIYPGCGIKAMGGRCRAHRYYEAPAPEKKRTLVKKTSPTKEDLAEFEAGYAFRSRRTIQELHDNGLAAMPCDCGEDNCPGMKMDDPERVARVLGAPR